MLKKEKLFGVSLSAAVAIAFVTAPVTPTFADNNDIVICPGVNACQGKSECRVVTNTCKVISEKGQNACKGQGVLKLSKKECVKRGSHGVIYQTPANVVNSSSVGDTSVNPD